MILRIFRLYQQVALRAVRVQGAAPVECCVVTPHLRRRERRAYKRRMQMTKAGVEVKGDTHEIQNLVELPLVTIFLVFYSPYPLFLLLLPFSYLNHWPWHFGRWRQLFRSSLAFFIASAASFFGIGSSSSSICFLILLSRAVAIFLGLLFFGLGFGECGIENGVIDRRVRRNRMLGTEHL